MPSIDNRVVEMQFNNAKFERGIKTSTDSLNKLKQSLNFDKQSASLKQFENYANSANFGALQNGIEAIKNRFSTLGIAGAEVIRTLTNEAMYLGSRIVNSIAAPLANVNYLIKEGGKQRALNVEQAKFQLEGLKLNFKDFDESINNAVMGTRFGYDEAAMAASQLAASGIKAGEGVGQMGHALLAISGVAAMTNSEYSDMANIFTTVASNGKLMTENIRSFSFRGLNVTAEMAKQWGKSEQQVSDMVSKGKVSFEMFSEAMYKAYAEQATKADKMFTGVLANIRAAWKKIGQDFWTPIVKNDSPIVKGLQAFKDLVNNTIRPTIRSLFEVDGKDFSDDNAWMRMVNNVGKAMQNIFKSEYMIDLVKRGIKSLGGTVQTVVDSVNEMVTSSHTVNIFKNTIDGITQSFASLKAFVQPFKDIFHDAFKDIIPKSILETVDNFSGKFKKFSDHLQIFTGVKNGRGDLTEVGNDLEVTFTSFYKFYRLWDALLTIFKNGLDIFKTVFEAVKTVVKAVLGELNLMPDSLVTIVEHFAEFTGTLARTVKRIWNFVSESKLINKTVEGVANFIAPVFKFITDHITGVIDAIRKLVGWGGTEIIKFFSMFNQAFFKAPEEATSSSPFESFVNWVLGAIDKIKEGFKYLGMVLAPTIEKIKSRIVVALSRISEAFKLDTLGSALKSGGIIAGIMIFQQLFAKYKWKIGQALARIGNPIKKVTQTIQNALGNISSMLAAQVKTIKVERVKTLAEAILIIAGAMFVLSLIPADQLAIAVAGVTSALIEIGAMMAFLSKLGASGDDQFGEFKFAAKATGLAIEMIGLAAALLILSAAMKVLASLDPEGMARGIFAVGLLLTALGAFIKFAQIDKDAKIPTVSLILLAVAVRILAGALGKIAELDNEGLARGILGVYSLMFAMGLFTKYANNAKGFTKTTFALILLSVAVNMIAKAAKSMGSLDNEALARGIFGIYNIMLAMGIFTHAAKNSKGFMKTVLSLVILAAAVKIMASVVNSMSALDNEALARGILGVYALMLAMGIFTRYAKSAKGLMKSAVAMVVLSAAMTVFAKVLYALGTMDPEQLALGLFALGVALLELGIALHYISKDSMKLGTMAGMLIMSVMINALAAALERMSVVDPEGMALALLALGVALAEIVIAMNALGGGNGLFSGISTLFKGAAFLLMGVGINILADALIKLSAVDPEKMALALFALCVSLIAMAAASLVASGPMMALGTAVALFGGGIGALAWGLAKLSVAIIPLVAVIVAAGPEIIQFLKDLVTAFMELLPVIVRGFVNAIAEFFVALAEKADELADALGNLIITILEKLIVIVPKLVDILAVIVSEIWKYLGPALAKLFPWLMEKLVAGWNWLKTNFLPLLGAGLDWIWGLVMGFFGLILKGIMAFVSAVNGLWNWIWGIITGFLTIVWNGLVSFVTAIINGWNWLKENFVSLLGGFLDWVWGLVMGFFGWILQGVINFVNAVNSFFAGLVETIVGTLQEWWNAGVEFVSNIIGGIGEKATECVNYVKQLVQDMVDGVTGFFQDFWDAGANLVSGLIGGVKSLWNDATTAIGNVGRSMWNKFTGFWQEKSPSRRAKWGAEMIVRGIVKGIDDYSYLASRSVEDMSEGMWNSMSFVGDAVNDALNSEVDPTITPVLDLSEIQNGANSINGIFGGRSLNLATDNAIRFENNRLDALNKLETTSTNADVVAALGLLRGDVNNLNTAMNGLQVVMDSGQLVGAIAQPMDHALGKRNTYRGRGI